MTNLKLPRRWIMDTARRLMQPEYDGLREVMSEIAMLEGAWNGRVDEQDNLAEFIYDRFLIISYAAAPTVLHLPPDETAVRRAMNPPMGGSYWWERPSTARQKETI